MNFKIGDVVIVSKPRPTAYSYFKGRIGTVLGINQLFNDLLVVDFNGAGSISFFKDEIEHAKSHIINAILNDL